MTELLCFLCGASKPDERGLESHLIFWHTAPPMGAKLAARAVARGEHVHRAILSGTNPAVWQQDELPLDKTDTPG